MGMLIDHTSRFLALRKTATAEFTPNLLPSKIRESIDYTKKQLHKLQYLQDRQCLPSFSKRKQKKEEINRLKNEIRLLLAKLDNFLREISALDYTPFLKRRMKDHFATQVHTILLQYREMEQNYLKKIKNLQFFDDLEDTRPAQQQQQEGLQMMLSQKKQSDIELVRDSLYFITSMLLEMN